MHGSQLSISSDLLRKKESTVDVQLHHQTLAETTQFVSVCVPTYNGAAYLRECLVSILGQTHTNFELLIVDDGSSDQTVEIAREYAAFDTRIRVVVNEKNLGLTKNWNRCVELAQGDWIKFVFQDDRIAPECLTKMLQTGSLFVAVYRNFIFEEGVPEDLVRLYLKGSQNVSELFGYASSTFFISPEVYCERLLASPYYNMTNLIGEPTAVLIHKSLFYQFGLFNNNLIHICDSEFWTRVVSHVGLSLIPEELATFRVHRSSTSFNNETRKKFRKQVLDPLIVLHDFALSPAFANLRKVAERSSINLIGRLWSQAQKVGSMATKDSEAFCEWKTLLESYPMLGFFFNARSINPHLKSEFPAKKL
jgi:glycosyltransferase involved in cell wall biosynthesis